MSNPVANSTLADAAKWLSEMSGVMISEREVLSLAFDFQWSGERPRGDDDEAAPGITAAARQAERIVQVSIPRDVEMRLRRWHLDGYVDRLVTQAERVIALDSYELLDLLTYDCVEITLPRPTDPYEGDEHAEIMLDGALVYFPQVRVSARGLYILAAWWQSIVGPQATTAGGFLPKQIRQEQAILQWLKANKLDAMKLPALLPGKAGVRSEARRALLIGKDLFPSPRTFNTAWQRLLDADELKYQ